MKWNIHFICIIDGLCYSLFLFLIFIFWKNQLDVIRITLIELIWRKKYSVVFQAHLDFVLLFFFLSFSPIWTRKTTKQQKSCHLIIDFWQKISSRNFYFWKFQFRKKFSTNCHWPQISIGQPSKRKTDWKRKNSVDNDNYDDGDDNDDYHYHYHLSFFPFFFVITVVHLH